LVTFQAPEQLILNSDQQREVSVQSLFLVSH